MLVSLDYARLTGQSMAIGEVVWLGDTKQHACTDCVGTPPLPPPPSKGTSAVFWSGREDCGAEEIPEGAHRRSEPEGPSEHQD